MCYFIIADLPIEIPAPPAGIELVDCHYELAAKTGRQLVCVTDGSCSCELYTAASNDEGALRYKYEKKGWSATKIERALADSARAGAARLNSSLAMWLASLAQATAFVRVFVHWDCDELEADVRHASMSAADVQAWKIPDEGWVTIE